MSDAIKPFQIAVPRPELADLEQRLASTRWPDPEVVPDWSQGIPLATVIELVRYWHADYEWAKTEQRLNRIPQFRTVIDGLPIHFLHVRSARPDATPVILTHGWPGSFLEFEQALPRLTHPPDDTACHVVVPSLPGYAFSGRPTSAGWNIHRIARAWCELMTRLGYCRFMAAGSDWGTSISTSIALQRPKRLIGLHLVPPLAPPDRDAAQLTSAERAALADLDERSRTGSGYSAVHSTSPQTLGYGLTDSPAGLAAWIAEKLWTWTDQEAAGLSTEQMLDNITLYWLTGTAVSSARLYWESIAEVSAWFTEASNDTIDVPIGCSIFPKEVPRLSRRWAARRFSNIVHWSEPTYGGHFAAWEQPDRFAQDLRTTVQALTA